MKRSFSFSGAAFSGHKNLDIFIFSSCYLDIFIFQDFS